jgi:hypothetical protein
MIVENQTYYHICKYPEFELNPFQDYNTEDIHRTFEMCKNDKKTLEAQLEEYRKLQYSELPSRINCFYVCRESQVEIWLKKLIGRSKVGYKIFKVSITGKILWANVDELETPEIYWEGCDEEDESYIVEGLFIGTYKALENCTYNFAKP